VHFIVFRRIRDFSLQKKYTFSNNSGQSIVVSGGSDERHLSIPLQNYLELKTMSLHAQLSPEASARLAAQRRNSSITSIFIAILVCVLLGMLLTVIVLSSVFKDVPKVVNFQLPPQADEVVHEVKEVTEDVQRKPAAPPSSMAKVLASNAPSDLSVPVPDVDVAQPALEYGNDNDFGGTWGAGEGAVAGDFGSSAFANIPASMKGRCSQEERVSRLVENGGNRKCESAVIKTLRWMKETQQPDGSWTDRKVSMTGLALLCYLGHCETPTSREFGDTVTDGIMFLINASNANQGLMTDDPLDRSSCYEHAIATYALAEAYTFCKELNIDIPNLEETVKNSAKYIVSHQTEKGGWDYFYKQKSNRVDNSVNCWNLQALKAVKQSGIKVTSLSSSANKGLDLLKDSQQKDGAVGYNEDGTKGHAGHDSMTGGAVLCWQQWGESKKGYTKEGVEHLHKAEVFEYPKGGDGALYRGYYATQAMINAGGDEWGAYNDKFRDPLLNAQETSGSYGGEGWNQHYRAALATLMLEVYYRFLPGSALQ